MITVETISKKIQRLPRASQQEVSDFVDDLLEKSARTNSAEKAAAWEDWANSNQENVAVIDDSREAIYEDE